MIFLPATLAVLAPLGYGLYQLIRGYTQFGPAAAEAWGRPWFTLASLATLILLLLGLYRLYAAHRFLAIHENGINIHLAPWRDHKIPWSQISGIAVAGTQARFLGLPLGHTYEASLYRNLGSPIRINQSLGDVRAISDQIGAHLFPRLQSQMQRDLQAGKWVHFGELAVHQKGLRIHDQALPWQKITLVYVDSGYLVVKSDRFEPIKIPVSKIPNLMLVFNLLENQAALSEDEKSRL